MTTVPKPDKPESKRARGILEKAVRAERARLALERDYSDITLEELTGQSGKVLNMRVDRLMEVLSDLEKVKYQNNQTRSEDLDLERGVFNARLKIQEKVYDETGRTRVRPNDRTVFEDDENIVGLSELSLDLKKDLNDDKKSDVINALKALNINFWPMKDRDGNETLVVGYPKDIAILRKIFSRDFLINYGTHLSEIEKVESNEAIKQRIQDITLFLDTPSTLVIDENFKAVKSPFAQLYAFGSAPITKVERAALVLDMEIDREIEEGQGSEPESEEDDPVDEAVNRVAANFYLGLEDFSLLEVGDDEENYETQSVNIEEENVQDPMMPDIANMPCYRKYKWLGKTDFLKMIEASKDLSETQKSEFKQKVKDEKKVLWNSWDKKPVSKEEREFTFLAAKDWKTGDKNAANALREVMLHNRNFILFVIKSLKEKIPKTMSKAESDDLFQMANFAIMRAVENYDPTKAESRHYLSYLRNVLESFIRKFEFSKALGMSNTKGQVREPSNSGLARKKVDDIERSIAANYPHRAPTELEKAREFAKQALDNVMMGGGDNISIVGSNQKGLGDRGEIIKSEGTLLADFQRHLIRIMYQYSQVPATEIFGDASLSLSDVSGDGRLLHQPATQLDGLIEKEMQREVRRSLLTLTPREECVLRMRFGIGAQAEKHGRELHAKASMADEANVAMHKSLEEQGMTLREVGDFFEVSVERIRQIEAKALRKLKHPARSRLLSSFLPEDSFNATENRIRREKIAHMVNLLESKMLNGLNESDTKVGEMIHDLKLRLARMQR